MVNKFCVMILSCFFLNSAFALVDYTPASSGKTSGGGVRSIDISQVSQNNVSRNVFSSARKSLGMFQFTTGLDTIDAGDSKYDLYNLGVSFSTPWKIYLDLNFNYGGKKAEGSTYTLGNTNFSVGATWLEYGQPHNVITFDVLGGMSLSVEESDIGSQRNDSYIGFMSKKNFGLFDFTLGFEYWFLDDASYENEYSIGSYNKYLMNLGWTATSDIRFDLGVQFHNISDIQNSEDVSFSEVTPQMNLKLASAFNLILGANFTSNRDVEGLNFQKIKLWNAKSLYGNSYFSKISFRF